MFWLARSLNYSQNQLQLLRSVSTCLPVIDVSDLCQSQSNTQDGEKVKTGSLLNAAIRNHGFLYISGHGIDQKLCSEVIKQAKRWFNLPLETKQQIALSPQTNYRGYQSLGTNVTRYDSPSGDKGYSRDHHEGIDLYKEQQGTANFPRYSPIHAASNPWPRQIPEFESVLKQYIEECLRVGKQVMQGIALGLQLPADYFETENTAKDSYWVTRVIHYPPLESSASGAAAAALSGSEVDRSEQLSCGEHSDYGCLTLLLQEEGIPALQVKDALGNWVTAEPIPGTLVVNIGDMMQVWSNGRYTPTLHRVINMAKGKDRTSVAFFYEPAFEASVSPIPELLERSSEPPLYSSVRYGSHLESKVLSNFELEGVNAVAS